MAAMYLAVLFSTGLRGKTARAATRQTGRFAVTQNLLLDPLVARAITDVEIQAVTARISYLTSDYVFYRTLISALSGGEIEANVTSWSNLWILRDRATRWIRRMILALAIVLTSLAPGQATSPTASPNDPANVSIDEIDAGPFRDCRITLPDRPGEIDLECCCCLACTALGVDELASSKIDFDDSPLLIWGLESALSRDGPLGPFRPPRI